MNLFVCVLQAESRAAMFTETPMQPRESQIGLAETKRAQHNHEEVLALKLAQAQREVDEV